MSVDANISELLDQWQSERLQGIELTAEELCAQCPELLESVRQRIEELKAFEQLRQASTGAETEIELWRPYVRPLPDEKYELLKSRGSGAFAEVWEATGPGGTPVALKRVDLRLSGHIELDALKLFQRNQIRHANLLAIHGHWLLDSNGQLAHDSSLARWLIVALELADETLWDRFEHYKQQGKQGLPRSELLGYMIDAAKGIDYLNRLNPGHDSSGIQHQDIKPQNLLLLGGSVKVADFGLVQHLRGSSTVHRTGHTPYYAPPEFYEHRVVFSSDQYSLAATYYHLLLGEIPPNGQWRMSEDRGCSLADLPEQDRPIVGRALALNPEDRWPSCRAFVEQLQNPSLNTAGNLGSKRPSGQQQTELYSEPSRRGFLWKPILTMVIISSCLSVIWLLVNPFAKEKAMPTPKLDIFLRQRQEKILLNKDFGPHPVRVQDRLQLVPSKHPNYHRYILWIGGNGSVKVISEAKQLYPDTEDDSWWYYAETEPTETFLLLVVEQPLAQDGKLLAKEIEALSLGPKIPREKQHHWQNNTWQTITCRFIPRDPFPPRITDWPDKVCKLLQERNIAFEGRTFFVAPTPKP